MSKAEQYAAQRFPVNEVDTFQEKENEIKRAIFCDGYRQAEKDLELGWDDIKTVDKLLNQCVDYSNPYQEVLKQYKAQKE